MNTVLIKGVSSFQPGVVLYASLCTCSWGICISVCVLIKGVSSFQGVILYTSLGSHNHSNTQYLDRKASYYTQFSKKGGNTPTKSKLKSLLVR